MIAPPPPPIPMPEPAPVQTQIIPKNSVCGVIALIIPILTLAAVAGGGAYVYFKFLPQLNSKIEAKADKVTDNKDNADQTQADAPAAQSADAETPAANAPAAENAGIHASKRAVMTAFIQAIIDRDTEAAWECISPECRNENIERFGNERAAKNALRINIGRDNTANFRRKFNENKEQLIDEMLVPAETGEGLVEADGKWYIRFKF